MLLNQCSKPLGIQIAFERIGHFGMQRLLNRTINRRGSAEFNIGSRCVEVSIADKDLPLAAQVTVQNSFSRPSLVGRQYVGIPGQVVNGLFKPMPTSCPRVRFVAGHHGRPLGRTHG